MVNFGKKVVKYRVLILILGVLLLIPSVSSRHSRDDERTGYSGE